MSFEIGTALNGGLYVAGHSFGNVYGGIIESGVRADFSGRITISGGLISGKSSVILTFLQPEGESPFSLSSFISCGDNSGRVRRCYRGYGRWHHGLALTPPARFLKPRVPLAPTPPGAEALDPP